jgi:hypothetical protein
MGMKCDIPSVDINVPKSNSCHYFLIAEPMTAAIYF